MVISNQEKLNSTHFDSEPLDLYKKGFLLRPRQPEKEIGAAFMKFKPNSTVERVLDRVNEQTIHSVNDSTYRYHSVANSPR